MRTQSTPKNVAALLVLALSAALALGGCPKKKSKRGPASGSGSGSGAAVTAAGSGSAAATSGTSAPGTIAALAANVRKAAKARKADACSSMYRCPGYDAAQALLKRGPGADALRTLTTLLHDEAREVRQMAGYMLYATATTSSIWHLAHDASRGKAKIDPTVADKLLTGLGKLEGYPAARAAMAAAWVASLTGKLDALDKVITGHANASVAAVAIEHTMTYGRMRAFARVKAYAKGSDAGRATAALRAPAKMVGWSEAERKAICPWARALLAHANAEVAAAAGALVADGTRCRSDEAVRALLAAGKKRIADRRWEPPFDQTFGAVCAAGPHAPGAKLCAAVRALLLGVVNNNNAKLDARERAVGFIAQQRRDKATLALMRKLAKHKVERVAQAARRWAKTLAGAPKLKK